MDTRIVSNSMLMPADSFKRPTILLPSERNHWVAEQRRAFLDFLSTLPVSELGTLLSGKSAVANEVSDRVDNLLFLAVSSIERASILRLFVGSLPDRLSHLGLPDGTRAIVSGHVLDRLMTRFNVASSVSCLRMLHRMAPRLQRVELSALRQVAQRIRYETDATHWRYPNQWTLIEANGALVTAYYPNKASPDQFRISAPVRSVHYVTCTTTFIH